LNPSAWPPKEAGPILLPDVNAVFSMTCVTHPGGFDRWKKSMVVGDPGAPPRRTTGRLR